MRKVDVFFSGLLMSLSLVAACGDDDSALLDSAVLDAGLDVDIMRCETDNECSDGLFCNGTETCTAGVCVPGEVVVCDDSIECTLDACNEVSNQCESLAPDVDEDGIGDAACVDQDGEPLGRDCDDADPRRFGGNLEVCDLDDEGMGVGLDEDCDPTTFGAIDSDGDSYFDARCFNIDDAGVRTGGDDCRDGRSDVNPGTAETCDHVDNNCDGNVDEGVLVLVAPDGDRDGFPTMDESRMECPGFAGLIAIDGDTIFDCNDADPTINPGQVEICDTLDNDCNGEADDSTQPVEWYRDADGDGFGNRESGVVVSCEPVPGSSLLDTDCNDDNPAVHPAAAETCDGTDEDCNGRADFEITMGDFEDDDGDGSADISCGAPRGVDCDDQDANTGGGTQESCDGRDNDCDDIVDEGATEVQWFYDGDGDGHGTLADPANPPVLSCSPPLGYVGSGGDCNDGDADRNPDAVEDCNSVDDDCDGAVDEAPAVCDCPPGTMDCNSDGTCETRIDSDANNCGGCSNLDPVFDCTAAVGVADAVCASMRCIPLQCQDGFDDCTPAPGCETSVVGDVNNCGECNRECGGPNILMAQCAEQECSVLQCEDGWLQCDAPDRCDTPNDHRNCGSCGNSCEPFEMCDGTDCAPAMCDAGEDFCDGSCTDTLFDEDNCGGCGIRCPGVLCVDGRCDCPPGQAACNGACIDVSNDTNNCGGCGRTCFGGQTCSAGFCQCPVGEPMLCGDTCVDPTLNGNCGMCNNTCAIDQSCQLPGRCECNNANESMCDGQCRDTDNDPNNCGGCGIECGVGGSCALGVCDPVVKLVQGTTHSCALRGNGRIVCWGGNSAGQINANTVGGVFTIPFLVPIPPASDLTAGADHTCAISDGDVWCWGSNVNGQLGRGAASPTGYAISSLGAGANAFRIAAGERHTCALSSVGIRCWGDNTAGQVGTLPAGGNISTPTPPDAIFSADDMMMGSDFMCALEPPLSSFPSVRCVGANGSNQLGHGLQPGEPSPVDINDLPFTTPPIAQAASGDHHSCLVMGGGIECFGANNHSQCSPSTAPASVLPPDLNAFPFTNVQQCATRGNATCVIAEEGVFCAGDNSEGLIRGVLVPGNTTNDDVGWSRIDALSTSIMHLGEGGQYHSCAIATNGRVFCWGRNDAGQLGNGSLSTGALGPVRVFALTP